jgi:superfamily II DNA helicase RecQ
MLFAQLNYTSGEEWSKAPVFTMEEHIIRVNKMIDYADYNTRCRSVILLDYFGEESDR